jgi:hypothetical protein
MPLDIDDLIEGFYFLFANITRLASILVSSSPHDSIGNPFSTSQPRAGSKTPAAGAGSV